MCQIWFEHKHENPPQGPITLLLAFLVHCLEDSDIGSEPGPLRGEQWFWPFVGFEFQVCHINWSHPNKSVNVV